MPCVARAVERLGVSGRIDREQVALKKQLTARDLRRLASEVSR